MAPHKDLSARQQAHDDRTVHLGGLQFKMSREEIAAVVSSNGFHDSVFYWPPKPAQYQHHTGWCFVEFADATTANSARQKLNGAQFGGRPAKAGKPGKAPGKAPSGQPKPSSMGKPNLSSSAGQSGVPAITKKIANVALSGDQQRESRATYSAGVLESDKTWREEAAAVVDKSQAVVQDREATIAAAEVENEAQPGVKGEITFFVHPFSLSPTAKAKIDLEATRLDSYRQAWGPKEDAPPTDAKSRKPIHDRCMELDKAYMAAGVRSGYPFARIIQTEMPHPNDPNQIPKRFDHSGLLARQYPSPAPDNDELANSMPVLMVKKGVVDKDFNPLIDTRPLPDVKLAPAYDVQAHMVDGWFPFVQQVPDEADVEKKCDRVTDVMTTDQPWKDTKRLFERGINATNYPGGSQWFPGAVLDRPVVDGIPKGNLSFCAAQCISNAPHFRNPGQIGGDLRTATNGGHVPIKKRPQGVGMGWGGYDYFHQWQANGRKINPSDVEKRDWQFDVREMVFVEKGTGKETTFEVEEKSAEERLIGVPQKGEGVFPGDLKSLYAVLNPNKASKPRYTRGRRGGEY